MSGRLYSTATIGSNHGAEGDRPVRIIVEEIMLVIQGKPTGNHGAIGAHLVRTRTEVVPLAADEPPSSGHSAGGGQIIPTSVYQPPGIGGHEAVRVQIIPGSPIQQPAGRVFAFLAVPPFFTLLVPAGLLRFRGLVSLDSPRFHKGGWENRWFHSR